MNRLYKAIRFSPKEIDYLVKNSYSWSPIMVLQAYKSNVLDKLEKDNMFPKGAIELL